LPGGQPFGIFFVEFGHAKLPVVVLRRILNALVVKKRNSANPADRQRWEAADLLFISAFGDDDDREIAFAHFHKNPDTTELPVFRVLGWDGSDTPLKLEHVGQVLKNRLHWPENAVDQDAWRKQWTGAFRHRMGHVISTAGDLADALAGFARKIRDAAITIMAHESEARGQLRKLHKAFQSSLVHDLKEVDFTDTYAQTVTYGLLTAAISRTEMSEGRHGTALTQDDITAMVPVTNPFLKEMLQEFLKVGGRSGGMDFDELGINEVVELLRGDETDLPAILRDFGKRQPGEDPVIHFYETFLKSYNKELRIQRGVFYTPQPVVGYIVRSVHELLQSEFGLEHGLADTTTWGEFIQKSKINNLSVVASAKSDTQSEISLPPLTDEPDEPGETRTISPDEPFVQILDPATGTATFPVEVIDLIHKHLKVKWKEGGAGVLPVISKKLFKSFTDYWNHYVPNHLLPRLHAFELMMAPYAVAHMKMGLKLAETGYRFGSEERVRVYLTNALEQPNDKQLSLIGFDALAHEAEAVNEIKRHKRFTVVIGNPPYTVMSANLSEESRRLIDNYRSVAGTRMREKSMLRLEMHLQDDYIKFFRISERCLSTSGVGILGLITNHSYLNNPTLRGVRYSLSETFNSLNALDLRGSGGKRDSAVMGRDENVFDILQGVAISLHVKNPLLRHDLSIRRADLFGARAEKYKILQNSNVHTTDWKPVDSSPPFYLFAVQDVAVRSEYLAFHSIVTAMPANSVGIVTGRDAFATDHSSIDLEKRLSLFCDKAKSDDEVRRLFGIRDAGGYVLAKRRKAVLGSDAKTYIKRLTYRPFDFRWIGYSRGFLTSDQRNTMRHMLESTNIALISARSNKSSSMDHFYCSKNVSETKCGESTTQSCVFPLYTVGDGELRIDDGKRSNFSHEFLRALCNSFALPPDASDGLPTGLTPEDIFHYIYAVFHSPGYRSRYAEFLKIDFPRLPLTGNLVLFRELAGSAASWWRCICWSLRCFRASPPPMKRLVAARL
jgi:hypothetical protein